MGPLSEALEVPFALRSGEKSLTVPKKKKGNKEGHHGMLVLEKAADRRVRFWGMKGRTLTNSWSWNGIVSGRHEGLWIGRLTAGETREKKRCPKVQGKKIRKGERGLKRAVSGPNFQGGGSVVVRSKGQTTLLCE